MSRPLRAGLLLSRTPVVTPKPSPFEAAYYHYQDELERRLMWTFPWYFYFKWGTLSQRRFNDLQRGPPSRHKDIFYPQGLPDIKHNRERRFKQEIRLPRAGEVEGSSEDAALKAEPRTTSADAQNDVRSLARKLDSTLFLLVQQNSDWRLPAFELGDEDKTLHEAAERGLRELGGEGINTWTVSNTPAAVLRGTDKPEFVIRSHILHGKFSPPNATDFAWLTKDEVRDKVDPAYYEQINVLL